ncbi:MAG TPA: OmpW family outer membrane protein [Candidatus Dependentiae bacterium]|nr:OmpW family outer membrane protein [Candidatus Dependentiae bacterium]HRQ62909.1 OmpW family outer membrane protein [Candidatus Dependentiae bacterium]
MLQRQGFLFFLISIMLSNISLVCRDVILEFKGANFLPTNPTFKDAYGGGALYGPELSVQLYEDAKWYVFTSADYFKRDGKCLSVADAKTLRLVPLALGIKYITPVRDWADFYLGLGFQPEYINIKSHRRCVTTKNTQWAFGGIGKSGIYIQLPHHLLIDLFIDFSFVKTHHTNALYGHTMICSKAKLNGAIFGGGLGYRFN